MMMKSSPDELLDNYFNEKNKVIGCSIEELVGISVSRKTSTKESKETNGRSFPIATRLKIGALAIR